MAIPSEIKAVLAKVLASMLVTTSLEMEAALAYLLALMRITLSLVKIAATVKNVALDVVQMCLPILHATIRLPLTLMMESVASAYTSKYDMLDYCYDDTMIRFDCSNPSI